MKTLGLVLLALVTYMVAQGGLTPFSWDHLALREGISTSEKLSLLVAPATMRVDVTRYPLWQVGKVRNRLTGEEVCEVYQIPFSLWYK